MAKTEKDLKISRIRRKQFLFKLGVSEMPFSIMKHSRTDKSMDINVTDGRSYGSKSSAHLAEDRRMRSLFSASHMSCRSGALSRFPQNIGRTLVQLYCPINGTVYDPFAGHNSRMELVYTTGRNYVGVDISHEFMEANRNIQEHLQKKDDNSLFKQNNTIQLIEGSSASVPLPDEIADFTITSPPYWDLEYYGDEPEQLGKNKTYEGFLQAIQLNMNENFRVLKPGSFCIWCINDFTKSGTFYAYHVDTFLGLEQAGFVPYTIYIIDLGVPVGAGFVQQVLKIKRLPKCHEYAIVVQKPGVNEAVEKHFEMLGAVE